MGTFRIDNKNPLYKNLIKLSTAYYRLKENGSGYTIDSHLGMAEVGSISDFKLQKQGGAIVLYEGDSALKLHNGEDFVIE
ncbi:hypothetical protein GOM44_06440, partial [Wolbachia endosymbiont of Atemnus politus]|nr:hypothetical protein [Wolbachia endosymbiont of Atemnus politus]